MNKPPEARKSKGISVEGFWRQLQDKTAKNDSGSKAKNSPDLSEASIDLRESSALKDKWESRFDEWLDNL